MERVAERLEELALGALAALLGLTTIWALMSWEWLREVIRKEAVLVVALSAAARAAQALRDHQVARRRRTGRR